MHCRLARALPILLALAPWPALADVTASNPAGQDRLTVEVADNGDARVEVGELLYVRHGGEEYLTFGAPGEDQISGRSADMLKFLDGMLHADPETAKLPVPAPVTPVLDPLPDTELLGLKGTAWRIWPKGKSDPAGSIDASFTTSPTLAPVKAVLQSAVSSFLDVFGPMDKRGHFRAILRVMQDKGAPLTIRNAATIQLLQVSTDRIDPAHFAAPEALLSAEMLAALADQMRAKLGEKNP